MFLFNLLRCLTLLLVLGSNKLKVSCQSDADLDYMGQLAPFETRPNAPAGSPVVTVSNGSYYGQVNAYWNVDQFFGIRFAAPVIGDNRFRAPQPVNEQWEGFRNATVLGPSCPAPFPSGLWTMEDCLNLQIYRPSGIAKTARLPVMVYFYGGGGLSGSASAPTMNMTTMVNLSAKIGKPFIAVVPQYRMRHYGTLASTEMIWEDATNIALRDNRMTLRWIHDNIGAFGGDCSKVTVMGESYGGILAGWQMIMNDGNTENLFRAAFMSSGSPTAISLGNLGDGQRGFDYLVNATNCYDTVDRVACLRKVKFSTLYRAFANATIITPVSPGLPVVDGLTLRRLPSEYLRRGLFAKVPVMIGGCRDEGTAFVTQVGNDTAELSSQWLDNTPTQVGTGWVLFPKPPLILPSTWEELLQLYPESPAMGAPFDGLNNTPPAYPLGLQFRRSAAIAGDIGLEQAKRFASKIFSDAGLPVYAYQWGTVLQSVQEAGTETFVGVTHGSDTPSMLYLKDPTVGFGNWSTIDAVSTRLSSSIISFIHDLTPNNNGISNMPPWPLYTVGTEKQMLYFNATKQYYNISYVSDTARQASMEFMWSLYPELRS